MKVIVIEVADAEELKTVLATLDSQHDLTAESPKLEAEVALEEPKAEVAQPEEVIPEPAVPEAPIEELAISSRLVKVLHEKHIDNIPALTSLRERDLKRIPQIGQASLREIKNALHKKGLRLRRRDYKGAA